MAAERPGLPLREALKLVRDSTKEWFGKRMPSLLALMLLILLPNAYYFELESSIQDTHEKLRFLMRAPTGIKPREVVVLLVDDEALRNDETRILSDAPPISRRYLGALVQKVAVAGPKALVLDFFLDRPAKEPADDKVLAEALSQAQSSGVAVVLPTRFTEGSERGSPLAPTPLFLRSLEQSRLFLGHANVEKSVIDRAVRRVAAGRRLPPDQRDYLLEYRRELAGASLYFGSEGVYSLSLPTQVLRSIDPTLRGDRLPALDRALAAQPLNILFTEGKEQIEVFSSARVEDPKVQARLPGRVVIIGPAYSGSSDRHLTPLSTKTFASKAFAGLSPISESMEGGVLVAYSFVTLREALHHARQIVKVPEWTLVLAMGALSAGLLVGLRKVRPTLSPGRALLLVGLAYVLASVIAFHAGLVVLPVIGPCSILLAWHLLARFADKLSPASAQSAPANVTKETN